jgi:hypothetical protein
MGYSMVNVDEIEGAGPSGAVRFVRRELGAEAFGINWFELAPGAEGLEHDETVTGQEEVSVVIARLRRLENRREGGAGSHRHLPPVRFGDRPLRGRRTGRDDVRQRRRAPRQLRAARPVLVLGGA